MGHGKRLVVVLIVLRLLFEMVSLGHELKTSAKIPKI